MFPKIISIGDFFLPTYGVMVALAFLAALRVTTRLGKREGLAPDLVTNLAIYCAIAGIAGAKLFMFFFDWKYYLEKPAEIFTRRTLQAAGVFQGGLLLALIVAIWYMKRNGMPILKTMDLFAPGLALGHAIGRLGCFFAGCCWGIECKRPWAVTFTSKDAEDLVGVPLGVPLHPTQLYEVFAELIVFAYLFRRMEKPRRSGEIIGLYLVASSVLRFAIEFFRYHEQALPFGLPFSLTQWISIGLAMLGIWFLRPSSKPSLQLRS